MSRVAVAIQAVASVTGVSEAQLRATEKRGTKSVVAAKILLCHLLVNRFGMSQSEIGRELGVDASTVHHRVVQESSPALFVEAARELDRLLTKELQSCTIQLTLHPAMTAQLGKMVATGMWGLSVNDAALRIIEQRLVTSAPDRGGILKKPPHLTDADWEEVKREMLAECEGEATTAQEALGKGDPDGQRFQREGLDALGVAAGVALYRGRAKT